MLEDLNGRSAEGHLIIRDYDTKESFVDQYNAIHFGNLSVAIAKSLAGLDEGHIKFMAFGNGGSSVTDSGTIFYRSPNVSNLRDVTASLYNETYRKDVSVNTEFNNVSVVLTNNNFADVRIVCTLSFGEPAGQDLTDNATSNDGDYVFDEIGIRSGEDPSALLTHVVFHPVQKALSRTFEIIYTIRIQMG